MLFPTVLALTILKHDKILPILSPTDSLESFYAPYIAISQSCVSFPAVDIHGAVSGGLAPSGLIDGECSDSQGQLYARSGTFGDFFGIMYALYSPKDQDSDYIFPQGQRHVWVSAMIWFPKDVIDMPVAVTYYDEERYRTTTDFTMDDTHVKLTKTFRSLLVSTRDHWFKMPKCVIRWDDLPVASRVSLNTYNWGKRTSQQCPFNDIEFTSRMMQNLPL